MNVREWALPVYTILMQTAIGTLFFLWLLRLWGNATFGLDEMNKIIQIPVLIILITIVFAMIGAHFHLSKPYLSFLAATNFAHSWLSREIVFTVLCFLSTFGLFISLWLPKHYTRWVEWFAIFAISFGFITVYCMGRIYQLPTQVAWDSPYTIPYYFITTFLLGIAALPAILLMDLYFIHVEQLTQVPHQDRIIRKTFQILAIIAILITVLILLINVAQINDLRMQTQEAAQASLLLLFTLYKPLLIFRYLALFSGLGVFLATARQVIRTHPSLREIMGNAFLACLLMMIGEILERLLFYATHVRIGV